MHGVNGINDALYFKDVLVPQTKQAARSSRWQIAGDTLAACVLRWLNHSFEFFSYLLRTFIRNVCR